MVVKKYRFLMGKTPDSTNLVTNGTFSGSLTGWTAGSQWSYVSGAAECFSTGSGNDFTSTCTLKQSGILTPGQTYQLSYKLKKATSHSDTNNGRVSYSIGGQYYMPYINYEENPTTSFTTFTHKNQLCSFGNDFLFFCFANARDNCAIDDVELYREIWNEPLDYEPLDWDKTSIVKKRDEVLNGLLYNYIADVTFIGDGYDYLLGVMNEDGYCAEVPIRIEEFDSDSNTWGKFFEGYIYINSCTFDLTKRQVKCSIEEFGSSVIMMKNKDIKVSVPHGFYQDFANNYPNEAPSNQVSIDFNDDSGAYPTGGDYENVICFDVAATLRKLFLVSTNYRLDCDSTFFTSGTFDNFCISMGGLLKTSMGGYTNEDLKLSITDLFTELNKLFNLSFSIDRSTTIPTVLIEPKIDFYNSTPVLTLNNVNNVEMNFDNKNIIKSIKIGYENVDANPTGIYENKPDGTQYYTSNQCSQEELNLVSKFIQSSTVLKSILDGTITESKYASKWFWIETNGTQTTNSGSGNYDYNVNIDEDDNLGRAIETLATSYLKATNGIVTSVEKSNTALTKVFGFSYPITKGDFDLLDTAFNTIQFDQSDADTTKEGFLLEGKYNISDGLTEFKLLTQ